MAETSPAEDLLYTTCRLEGRLTHGTSVGTGFLYWQDRRLFLVTNRHVIEGVQDGHFLLNKAQFNENTKTPVVGQGYQLRFDEKTFVCHPDPMVDVAVMNISSLVAQLENGRDYVYWKHISEALVPKQEHVDKFIGPLEEIIFVGYPSGIWDTTNLFPVARKGMTATPYYIDFCGAKKFLIDASVFPGSSGSPVFIYYAGGYPDRKGTLYAGNRVFFVGIIAQTYHRLEHGEIVIKEIPTRQVPLAQVCQMIDLGIVFKPVTIVETIDHYINLTGHHNDQAHPTPELDS